MIGTQRKFFILVAVTLLGGFLAGILAWPLALRWNVLGTANLLDSIVQQHNTVTKIEERTIVAPQADYFGEAIKRANNNVVAIQSFSQGTLLRSGSGIVLTQDGIIATTNSVVPAGADFYQVLQAGKIYKARVVQRNLGQNFALISVIESNFPVSQLENKLPELGDSLLIFSRQTELGKDRPFIASALVAQVDEEKQVFRVGADYADSLFGAALINHQGNILGIMDFRNTKPSIILAKDINDQLNSYFAKLPKS